MMLRTTVLALLTIHCLAAVHRDCIEKALEIREENANVVLTGTVKDLYPDEKHPNMYKGEVEIKRIMKGDNVVQQYPGHMDPASHHKMIMVDGFGDPHICDSGVRRYDTRIFLLSKNGNGELKLNSSLVRITLNNLEHTDAVVQDKPFQPRPEPPEEPCEMKYCAYGAVCRVNMTTNDPYCKCIEVCSAIFAPVCGSDGVTYSNECKMRVASCGQQKRIKIRSQGSCDVKDPCKDMECRHGAKCVPSLDGLIARCECRDKCDSFGDHIDNVPICGSDGMEYANRCEMEKMACRRITNITVKFFGKCDPCKDVACPDAQVCQLNNKREPVCRCNQLCTLDFRPVCASNGQTFSNECLMRVQACKTQKDLRVLFQGECTSGFNPCDSVRCRFGEECYVDKTGIAECRCPEICHEVWRPVCGTDGVTYDNKCELQRQSCINYKDVSVDFDGRCGGDGPCADYLCNYGALCVVRHTMPACECPTCTEEFKPVCGTDGISYSNECKMQSENCENKRNVRIAYKGLCNGCENMNCDYYSICVSEGRNAKCVCPDSCVQVIAEVCGTDGVTYDNECRLKVAACNKKQYIIVASQGSCDLCKDLNCKYGAVCQNGKCICPQSCPDNQDPVCANNGVTYDNECEMRRAACTLNTELEIFTKGECDYVSGSGKGKYDQKKNNYLRICLYLGANIVI